ncbi:MAG: hypothetical protein NW226_07720 [Microscillaceae bacterium]|nr:hypothetical protein [Microscillaceae bacterium]
MKPVQSRRSIILSVAMVSFALMSCSILPDPEEQESDSRSIPFITHFSAIEVSAGESFYIYGGNFGNDLSKIVVQSSMASTRAHGVLEVKSLAKNRIEVVVPNVDYRHGMADFQIIKNPGPVCFFCSNNLYSERIKGPKAIGKLDSVVFRLHDDDGVSIRLYGKGVLPLGNGSVWVYTASTVTRSEFVSIESKEDSGVSYVESHLDKVPCSGITQVTYIPNQADQLKPSEVRSNYILVVDSVRALHQPGIVRVNLWTKQVPFDYDDTSIAFYRQGSDQIEYEINSSNVIYNTANTQRIGVFANIPAGILSGTYVARYRRGCALSPLSAPISF